MQTQEIAGKLRDEAENGNVAVGEDETVTVVPADYAGRPPGESPRSSSGPSGK
jgi:hypothetical protein